MGEILCPAAVRFLEIFSKKCLLGGKTMLCSFGALIDSVYSACDQVVIHLKINTLNVDSITLEKTPEQER